MTDKRPLPAAWQGQEPRWLDADQQRAWRALVLGSTLLFERLDQDLRAYDLSLTEYEILVRLSESEDRQLRMAQLADALAHSRSRVTHTVKRMEHDGLVLRCNAADDGRGVFARLTDKGLQMLRNVAPVHVRGVREYLVDRVAPDDLDALGRALDAVADQLIGDHPEMEMR